MNELPEDVYRSDDPLIRYLKRLIRLAVKVLAVLMTVVIFFGVVDVAWMLWTKLSDDGVWVLTITDMLATFGAFMAVLIAIEIFVNITVYLRDDVIHVKIVMATALMAIARKVIILDFEKTSVEYVFATAAVVLAMSIGYWLVFTLTKRDEEELDSDDDHRLIEPRPRVSKQNQGPRPSRAASNSSVRVEQRSIGMSDNALDRMLRWRKRAPRG
jgi:uncharacterized membrane protein (DUF373 family)